MQAITPLGDRALLIQFEQEISVRIHTEVKTLYEALRQYPHLGVIALTPAYCSITVVYNPNATNYATLTQFITKLWHNRKRVSLESKKRIEIPVCYEDTFALDKSAILKSIAISWEELITIHSSEWYLVYMLGFVPGFLYLGGLNEKLHLPRKKTPRSKVPEGSICIGGQQTGIYPLETPGGWQIIGRSPINHYRKLEIRMGDEVQFKQISMKEYNILNHSND